MARSLSGITITAKNAATAYEGITINLIDTPGHADFGGEVERVLNMVDSILLVVDSVEGPKPQTRFVLSKALELGIKPLVVVNKVDRPSARPDFVVDATFDLFSELNATDEQQDFEVVYSSAIKGMAGDSPDNLKDNIEPLFQAILRLPRPRVEKKSPLQFLTANIEWDDFKGKLGIGRIHAGRMRRGESVLFGKPGKPLKAGRVNQLFVFHNLGRKEVEEANAGDVVMLSGLTDICIGDTVTDPNDPVTMDPIKVEEPTVRMTFGVNKSPLAGKEGKFLTSRMIRDRLFKELDKNVALKVVETDSPDVFEVSGRGQLHLTVLIETMRREGFEMFVGPPSAIMKTVNGELQEPFETLEVQVPEEFVGRTVDLISRRKGEMLKMQSGGMDNDGGTTLMVYVLPTRAMFGLKNQLMTATRGTAILNMIFNSYKKCVGSIEVREKGSLLETETGIASTFGILSAQDRGGLFCSPKDAVYKDMILGVHQRPGDLHVNICKVKALNNIRVATKSITEGVVEPLELTLDGAIEYVQSDELVEVTPINIRMLKNPIMNKKRRSRRT